ncbi:MAG: hypothetical protein PUK25_03685 [Clostridiales bacterium]|nr:hypothetical protein [Clostridiales bacterium]
MSVVMVMFYFSLADFAYKKAQPRGNTEVMHEFIFIPNELGLSESLSQLSSTSFPFCGHSA